mmetsp:Transcript_12294/g.25387  ORF Transcript_12294/g.25387 Transcript_12294/m.25387 type:complete len:86 (-) Transcript_12294:376-633(-)
MTSTTMSASCCKTLCVINCDRFLPQGQHRVANRLRYARIVLLGFPKLISWLRLHFRKRLHKAGTMSSSGSSSKTNSTTARPFVGG